VIGRASCPSQSSYYHIISYFLSPTSGACPYHTCHSTTSQYLPQFRIRQVVGNGSLMAALDSGYARTPWPQSHMYALVKGRASSKNVFTPLVFFPSHLFSRHTFLPVHNFPQALLSIKLSSINHDLHLHVSGSSPPPKTPTVNHYLLSQDFRWKYHWIYRLPFLTSGISGLCDTHPISHHHSLAFIPTWPGSCCAVVILAMAA